MADELFSQEALRKTIQELPQEQGGIGVVVQPSDVGVVASVRKDVGKPGGWSVAATGQWFKEAGYKAAAWIGWTGSPKT